MTAPSAAELVERLDALYKSTDLIDAVLTRFDSTIRDNWPAIRALLAAAPAIPRDPTEAMRLWLLYQPRVKVWVYARSPEEASEYVGKVPLTWHLRQEARDWREVLPPKGPSPSILCHESSDPRLDDD